MSRLMNSLGAIAVVSVLITASIVGGTAATSSASVPTYDHIFVIVEENHGFADVIGNPAAPNLNALARQYGLATQYFGVSHPSEPNYVGLLGGSTFNVNSDNPYYMQNISQPGLITQLDNAGISWKAYLQSLPYAGYKAICYPARCNGTPDNDPLYVSKHDAIQNFLPSRTPADWSRQVPIEQLSRDLASANVPRFGYVIPDECRDQHGDPPYCLDSGNPGDPQDQKLVAIGDQYLGQLVSTITGASFWSRGQNAIAIIYDEGDDNVGCCDAGNSDPNGTGGGQVATIVVTNHGQRHFEDAHPYNHYSLLSTVQQSFGLGCLQFTCDTANVSPMAPLFAIKNSKPLATTVLPVPSFATPTPTPSEPQTLTSVTPTSGGWSVVPSPLFGTNDNSLGAVAASSANDVWAVGNFLPDTATSNQDATISLANHFDGRNWSAVPTPNGGVNFNTLHGVAASGGLAWAVGVQQNQDFQDRALIEAWNGAQWNIVTAPDHVTLGDRLFAASATSTSDVWAVGDQQGKDGRFSSLIEHWNGSTWSIIPSPNPGAIGNHLYGVTALATDNAWAVGQQQGTSDPDQALTEHWDGSRWTVVPSPSQGTASVLLTAVAGRGGNVWAVGETDDSFAGARPLVEQWQGGRWTSVALPPAGSIFTSLWGVTVAGNNAWAVGTYVDPASGNNLSLVLTGSVNGAWTVVKAPDPGTAGSNILGGVAVAGDTLWAVGQYDNGGSRQTLIERHILGS